MKVLNVCRDDWANFSYDNSMALRSVGIDADAINVSAHAFSYDHQAKIEPDISKICELIKDYDVIQFFHDNMVFFNQIKSACAGKKLIVYHTSSYYRKCYASIDNIMDIYADKAVCAMPEFMERCKHPRKIYMVGAVDTEALKPSYSDVEFRFAHYPSNPDVKGSTNIFNMMEQMDIPYAVSYDIVPADEQIERMRNCNVYIELFSMKDGMGSPYGNFGISALEAAALGKIVVTNCVHLEVYHKHYGFMGLHITNTPPSFTDQIKILNGLNPAAIKAKQIKTRKWVVDNHSYQASGQYMLKHILN